MCARKAKAKAHAYAKARAKTKANVRNEKSRNKQQLLEYAERVLKQEEHMQLHGTCTRLRFIYSDESAVTEIAIHREASGFTNHILQSVGTTPEYQARFQFELQTEFTALMMMINSWCRNKRAVVISDAYMELIKGEGQMVTRLPLAFYANPVIDEKGGYDYNAFKSCLSQLEDAVAVFNLMYIELRVFNVRENGDEAEKEPLL